MIAALFSGLWEKLLAVAVGLLAVAGILFGARQAGRAAERLDTIQRNAEIQREQLQASTRRPRDRGELAQRLRDGRF